MKRMAVALVWLIASAACTHESPLDVQGIASCELDALDSVSAELDVAGGLVALPNLFSLEIPSGGLSSPTTVRARARDAATFPVDAGLAVPGAAFDIEPTGTSLRPNARLELCVDRSGLRPDEEVRIAVAVARSRQPVVAYSSDYDAVAGVVRTELNELVPVAVVVADDVIEISSGQPGPLPSERSLPVPATTGGTVTFAAMRCEPDVTRCTSAAPASVELWADDVVRSRMGDYLVLFRPSVRGTLRFGEYDGSGVPTQVYGEFLLGGSLRGHLEMGVLSDSLLATWSTGPYSWAPKCGALEGPTGLRITETSLVFASVAYQACPGTPREILTDVEAEFGLAGSGTDQVLFVQVELEVEFGTFDEPRESGIIVARFRLPRS